MNEHIVICVREGANREEAQSLADKLNIGFTDKEGDYLSVIFDKTGVTLSGFGLSYRGDFESMLRRIGGGRLQHEMLAKAVKMNVSNPTAVDATAGMGEDSIIIAAYGYDVTLCEQNPVIAALLRDTLNRASNNPDLTDIIARMHLYEGNSIDYLRKLDDKVDMVYLDPMFPNRQKSGLIGKKLQLIQKLEPPCFLEEELFEAAMVASKSKIVVKRPLKSPNLAEKKPNYVLEGKAIRYDCYVATHA